MVSLETVPIEDEGVHIFIRGRINGKKARFLVDTGASRSVLDRNRLKRFFARSEEVLEKVDKLSTGLGTNSMESNMALLPLLSFGRILIRRYHMAVLDLSHVNDSYAQLGLARIDGVIGGDILLRFQAVIDYRSKDVRLTPTVGG